MVKQEKLLIVESNRDITTMLRIYFEMHGFTVETAPVEKEPLGYIQNQAPVLILLDAEIQKFQQCYAAFQQIRANPTTNHIPILFLAERDDNLGNARIHRIAALQLGVEDYITRPFDVEELRLRVNNKIDFARRQLRNKAKAMARNTAQVTQGSMLVVEDDFDISNMLQIFFTNQGYSVEVASRGYDALEMCRRLLPDVIILDIMLPDIDGYTVCKELRLDPQTQHIPILFLTQRDERSDLITGLELGADDYITKPFDIEELKLRVSTVLNHQGRVQSFITTQSPGQEKLAKSIDRVDLRNRLAHQFNIRELRNLCFELDVNHEELEYETVGDFAREIVSFFKRRGELDRLIRRCQQLRPNFFNRQHR
jgi:DNA-binding response OmpR family regulator